MPINLDFSRPKSVTTNTTTAVITAGTAVEVEGAGVTAEESYFLPFNHGNITPSTFTVANCNITSGSATITTTTSNGFANVRVGDVVTVTAGGGTIAANTVLSVNSVTSITITVNATVSSTTANSSTIQLAPPVISPTMWGIRLLYQKSGSVITIRPTIYFYDGSLGSTIGTVANATTAINLTDSSGNAPSIDFDAFYNAIRVTRSV
jgi:hypothetical protein